MKPGKINNIFKKILIITGIVIAALAVMFFIYTGNYSHADKECMEALNGTGYVTVTSYDDRIIFMPSEDAQANLKSGLIFYPGGKVEYTAYAPLMDKLAERGVTCILLNVPFNLAVLDINAAEGVIRDFNSKTDQPIDKWYLGGHSLGGATAAMYLAGGHVDEYEGLILLGAYSKTDISDLDIDVLSVIGENDGLITQKRYDAYVSNLPENSVRYTIPGGCHAYFGSYGEQKGDGKATITPNEQREITSDVITEWMMHRNTEKLSTE